MVFGPKCGPVCQHPTCWSAERERIRLAFFSKENSNTIPKPTTIFAADEEYNDSVLPTYNIVNLSDFIRKEDDSVLRNASSLWDKDSDSDLTLYSNVSSDNATCLSRSFRRELRRKFFIKSGRQHSNDFPTTPWVTPSSSKLCQNQYEGNDDFAESERQTDTKFKPYSVLSVKIDGGLNTYSSNLVWVPSKRKKKRKKVKVDTIGDENGKVSTKCLDGDILGLESSNSWKLEKSGQTPCSLYSGSMRKTPTKNFPRRLPPLEHQLHSRHGTSQRSQRAVEENSIGLEMQKPLTVSQLPKVAASGTKERKFSSPECLTPFNTRNTSRQVFLKGKTPESEVLNEHCPLRAATYLKAEEKLFRDQDTVIIPENKTTIHLYDCRRSNDISRQPLNLPRISVPRQYLKHMPIFTHHCRNSIPQYYIPDVQLEPLEGTGNTPSIASTDSLIRRISMDIRDDISDIDDLALDFDGSSIKAYEKLLQDFPSNSLDSCSASASSDAIEWRFTEPTKTPAPTPLTPLKPTKIREFARSGTTYSSRAAPHSSYKPNTPRTQVEQENEENQEILLNFADVALPEERESEINLQNVQETVNNINTSCQKIGEIQNPEKLTSQLSSNKVPNHGSYPVLQEHADTEKDVRADAAEVDNVARDTYIHRSSSSPNITSLSTLIPSNSFQLYLPMGVPFKRYGSGIHNPSKSYSYKKELFLPKSRSVPQFAYESKNSKNDEYSDYFFSINSSINVDSFDYQAFKSSSRKHPPLLMSTPGRLPPQPGHQPSQDSVPDELTVRSIELFQKTDKSKMDLSNSLIIEKLSLNRLQRSLSDGIESDYNNTLLSSQSTPIVVPTMESVEQGSMEGLLSSPLENGTPLPDQLSTKTSIMEALEAVEPDGDARQATEGNAKSLNGSDVGKEPEESGLSESDFAVDGDSARVLSQNSERPLSVNSDLSSATKGTHPELEAASPSFLTSENMNENRCSDLEEHESAKEIYLPLDAPPSSPLLSSYNFEADLDLNLNLEDELRKAVDGLQDFSFENLHFDSVDPIEAVSIASSKSEHEHNILE